MKQQDILTSSLRPVDPYTREPLELKQQPGYYPLYNTMSQKSYWDEATRRLVEERVGHPPQRSFFSEEQWKFWVTVFDHILPQSDRTLDHQISIVGPLDRRLAQNRTAGYRFEDMPQDREVYHSVGIEAINQEAHARFDGDFVTLSHLQQEKVLQAIHDGRPKGAPGIWAAMSVHRFWQQLVSDAIEAYYAHPWGWDEIGFGGPAYPRAYTRLERGEPEPWEVEESRYAWKAPEASLSDEVENAAHHLTEAEQHRHKPPVRAE